MFSRKVFACIVTACIVLSATACGGGIDISRGDSAPDPRSQFTTDVTSEPQPDIPDNPDPGTASQGCGEDGQSFASDVRLARCLAEVFWTQQFQASGSAYRPIQDFVPYTGYDGPPCGDQPSVPNNAFYCPIGHFIAFDANWLEGMYNELGDAAVYVVIPHEFGHAVQAQLTQNFSFDVQRELQADCYAGGTLSALIQANQLQAEEGDEAEVMNNLIAAGDPTDAWWEPGAHGTPERRQAAFVNGYQRGVGGC